MDDLDIRRMSPLKPQLQGELKRIIHILAKRGRIIKVRKIVTLDASMIAALVVIRRTISIPVLRQDVEACGYKASLDVAWETRFPTGVYGLSDKYLLSMDLRANAILLTPK